MRKNEWSGHEITKKPTGVGEAVPIKYGVPYEWGALHVSQEADKAYGLNALVEGVTKEVIEPITLDDQALRTDIFLMGPEEFVDYTDADDDGPDIALFRGHASMHKNGIELRVAMNQNKERTREAMLGDLAIISKIFGIDMDELRSEHDIPVTESIDPELTQHIAHALADFAGNTAQRVSLQYLRKEFDERALYRATFVGAAGLAGAGIVAGFDVLTQGSVDGPTAGVAAALAGYYGFRSRQTMKQHLRDQARTAMHMQVHSNLIGMSVGQSIHDTFCTAHFDYNAEAMFRD